MAAFAIRLELLRGVVNPAGNFLSQE